MTEKKVRVTKATKILQSLTGAGNLKKMDVVEAQINMEKIDPAYEQWTRDKMRLFQNTLDALKADMDNEEKFENLIGLTMDLKANSGFFGNDNLCILCSALLDFLEDIPKLNQEAIKIIDSSFETMKYLSMNFFTPMPKEEGVKIITELKDQLEKYYKDYNIKRDTRDPNMIFGPIGTYLEE